MQVLTTILVVCIFGSLGCSGGTLESLIDTDFHKCIICLCHARSGCWVRQNCARYSINFNYWKLADSPTIESHEDPDSITSYNKCMKDENCILHTIKSYTEKFNNNDCNCDGSFNCIDRLSLHLNGQSCSNMISNTYINRYNNCARRYDQPQFIRQSFEECEAPQAV